VTDDEQLTEDVAQFHADPLGFVLYAFPWGEPGTELEKWKGPRAWQRETLELIGELIRSGFSLENAIQIATASGHGIGKSALVSMAIMWAMSTREDTRGVVTANTMSQLVTKTWPELAKWHRLCLTRDWFEFTASALYSRQPGHEKTWRIDAIAWNLKNTEAFAGLHNEGKRILVVFDEASAIPDPIWEVTEGALTDADTEIIWLAFGNPTRNTGRFFEAFGRLRHRWKTRQIDSRTVEGTNAKQIAKWLADYGEISDWFKVRVRGIFPNASSLQFIARDIVDRAMGRVANTTSWARRVAAVGVDVARFGDDESVIATRVGRDAKSIPMKRFRGLDTMQFASRVGEHVNELRLLGLKVVLFIDGGGVGGGVVDRLRQLNFDPIEVQFGGKANDERKYANKRAEIWGKLKEWLPTGHIPSDEALAADLTSVEYGFNVHDQILLESKKAMKLRGLASPDAADALAVTFAQDVPEFTDVGTGVSAGPRREYDPFALGAVCGAPPRIPSMRAQCSLLPSRSPKSRSPTSSRRSFGRCSWSTARSSPRTSGSWSSRPTWRATAMPKPPALSLP
jgi:hypothetical protein